MKFLKLTFTAIILCLTLDSFAAELKAELNFRDALVKGDY